MLKYRWQKIALSIFLLGLLAFAASFAFPPKYEICGPNQYTHAKECSQHYAGPIVFLWVMGFLDDHAGSVTAIATIFIAGFTWTLYWVTGEAVRISKRALVDVERPYVFISNFAWGKTQNKVVTEPDYVTLHFTISNEGKIPAIIDDLQIDFNVGELPALAARGIRDPIEILPPATRRETFISFHESMMEAKTVFDFEGTTAYRVPVCSDKKPVFILGVVRYHGPFTKDHETRLCWKFTDILSPFEEFGGSERNYVR